MRERKKRTSRSTMVLDIRKLYLGGLANELESPINIGMPTELEFEIDFCQRVLELNPNHYDSMVLLGDAYTRNGQYFKGLELDIKLAQLKPDNEMIRYNLACSYALTGQTDNALGNLTRAVDLGYNDVKHLCEDNDLAPLKSDPRFQKLIQKLVEQYGAEGKNKGSDDVKNV